MRIDTSVLIWIGIGAVVAFFILVNKATVSQVEIRLKSRLHVVEQEKARAIAEIDKKLEFLQKMRSAFEASHAQGRRWLIALIADAVATKDTEIENELLSKSRPAPKAAEEMRRIKNEKRHLVAQVKHLECMLKMLYESYPILGDYAEDLLDSKATIEFDSDVPADADLVAALMSTEDYKRLSPSARNQLALDRWLSRKKSNVEIGRMYERYIGSRYEENGWHVRFHGATEGLEDLGRDLICDNGKNIHIVQAKYWAAHKTIHEKHIFQLYGTTFLYALHADKGKSVRGMLFCTSKVSEVAREAAVALNIKILELPMANDYAMIKCNVNGRDKIYHLPFDQQYDRVRIGSVGGECYVKTVAEAEEKGFRRAKRWMGQA